MATTTNEFRSGQEDLYPSRAGGSYRFLERRDPLTYGAARSGPLGAETLASYANTGFWHRPGFLGLDRIAACREELERLRHDTTLLEKAEAVLEPDNDALRSLFAIHLGEGDLSRLCRDPLITEVARQILGSEVYIHQSRINYKPGFRGREFFWHSDFETWHVEDGMPRMRAVTCSIALEPNYETNGPLMVIHGSHKRFLACAGQTPEEHYKRSLKKQELGVPDAMHLAELVRGGTLSTTPGPAGTVTFFDCNLMHGSNSNITPWPRSNVFVVFNSVQNRLLDPYCGRPARPEFVAHRTYADPVA